MIESSNFLKLQRYRTIFYGKKQFLLLKSVLFIC